MREEFEKWEAEYGTPDQNAWDGWQAATSSTAAKYQARVKELEDALRIVAESGLLSGTDNTARAVYKALYTTSPDQALKQVVLDARIDDFTELNLCTSDAELFNKVKIR